MSLYIDKTMYVVFKQKNKIIDEDLNFLSIKDNVLRYTEHCKCLGVWIDNHVSCKYHIMRKLCNKLNSGLYMLRKVKHFYKKITSCFI